MDRAKVLVIDDERDLVELVRYNLEREGFEVLGAFDGASGLAMALERRPDLILLDRMMPGPDGVETCRKLRSEARTADVPVIFLSAKAAEADRIHGLDAGADDYVTKPFSPRELAARVRARLRRPSAPEAPPGSVKNGDLEIDSDRREVTYGGRPLNLSPAEFRILQFIAASPGRVMFRRSAPPAELLLGHLAVRQRRISPEQRREVVAFLERNPSRRFGEVLVERFYLSQADLEPLLAEQSRAFGAEDESSLLGRILVRRGFATAFQVNEALRLQGRLVEAGLTPVPPLGQVLVRKGALTPAALLTALQLQNFMLYRCPECAARIPVSPGPVPYTLACPACGGKIPALFSRMAEALHRVLEEAAGPHVVGIPEEVLAAAEDSRNHFGKYVLVRGLGRGGAGEVYCAWQRDANRIVALKRLPRGSGDEGGPRTPFGNPDAVKRFFTEARAIADLDHPYIVPLYDYGTADDCFYYTMACIEGRGLDALLRERQNPASFHEARVLRGLPARLALSIVRDVALALDYAHRRGVCHRDIKPQNILIEGMDRPWLIDFGLARITRLGDADAEKGVVLGTPYYMPPEQAAGDMSAVDDFSDIYSLGAVLYELLAGICPYGSGSPEEAYAAVLYRSPEPLESIAPGLPPGVYAVVRRALQRRKEDRHARAGDLASEIQDALDRLPPEPPHG